MQTKKLEAWLQTEIFAAVDCNTDMCNKLVRVVQDDITLHKSMEGAPAGLRRTMIKQEKDKLLSATKNGRAEAKDWAKATTTKDVRRNTSTKLVGDDFTGGLIWDGPALKYDDGAVAERLDDVYDLGAVPGYYLDEGQAVDDGTLRASKSQLE